MKIELKKVTAFPRYRSSVRIGNWYEDVCLEESEVKAFLIKRQKNELLIQKTRMLFVNFHFKVSLDTQSDNVRFGSLVQIESFMQLSPDNTAAAKMVLSIVVNEQVVRKSLQINELCEITVAPSVQPCMRNSFRITSFDSKIKDGEPLRYGQAFRIECVEAEEKPLYMFSMQKSADLSTMIQPSFVSQKRGEINLPVAFCQEKKMGPGKLIPAAYTKWCCIHPNPKNRFETEGEIIPFNSPVLICHMATNRNLAAESMWAQTLFGPEFLVSVQNYIDIFHRVNPKNIWIISNGKDNVVEESTQK